MTLTVVSMCTTQHAMLPPSSKDGRFEQYVHDPLSVLVIEAGEDDDEKTIGEVAWRRWWQKRPAVALHISCHSAEPQRSSWVAQEVSLVPLDWISYTKRAWSPSSVKAGHHENIRMDVMLASATDAYGMTLIRFEETTSWWHCSWLFFSSNEKSGTIISHLVKS